VLGLVIETSMRCTNSEDSNWKKSSRRAMVDMNRVSLRSITAPALLLGVSLGGCLTGKSTIGELDDTDDPSGTASDGDVTTASSSSGLDASDGEVATTDEPPLSCAPPSPCTFPDQCAESGSCDGSILSAANEDGCVRQTCTAPEHCAAGTTCFLPWSWGHCGHHGCTDDPEGGGWCDCGFGLDCNNNGFCVPDEAGLPPSTNGTDFCGALTDPTACEDSGLPAELGACHWYEGYELPQAAACEERVAVGRCTFRGSFFTSEIPFTSCEGDESRTPLAYVDAGVVTVLFVDPEAPPTALMHELDVDTYGWLPCDQPEVEAECACACA
jgi:hypothetical protein